MQQGTASIYDISVTGCATLRTYEVTRSPTCSIGKVVNLSPEELEQLEKPLTEYIAEAKHRTGDIETSSSQNERDIMKMNLESNLCTKYDKTPSDDDSTHDIRANQVQEKEIGCSKKQSVKEPHTMKDMPSQT